MGIIGNFHYASQHENTKATQKLVRQQAVSANDAASRDALVLEHLAYQSNVLTEIRDLLRAAQSPSA